MTRSPSRATQAATVLLVCSVGCVVLLHVVRAELDPVASRLSEYAIGPFGWLMAAAFAALGLGLLALAGGLVDQPGIALLVAAAGVGMLVSGAVPTEPDADTVAELVHSRASGLATVALLVAVGWRAIRQRRGGRVGFLLAVAAIVLGAASPLLHDSPVTGLSQRLLWATLLAWLLVTARRLRR